jgi:signal transduction histidine kinase
VDYGAAPPLVLANDDRLAQVFINLISNAINHNTAASPRLDIRCTVRDGRIAIDLQDNGPGIPAADRERIFNKFSRAWTSQGPAAKGAGLGLAISRAILQRMSGTVELMPAGKGACFRVTLPIHDAPRRAAPLYAAGT